MGMWKFESKSMRKQDKIVPDTEESYFECIRLKIEYFGVIQREFVLQTNGVAALLKLIVNMGGSHSHLSLRDPVMQKGKEAASRVIAELERQCDELGKMRSPEVWERFHNAMVTALSTQIEGYREMLQVYEDYDIKHIVRGKDMVKRGMSIFEGGIRIH